MSDQTQDGPHHGPIKTAKQFFWTSVGAFVVPMFVIIGLVFWVTSGSDHSPGETDPAQKVQQRIAPVASVKIGDPTKSEEPEGGAATQTASAGSGGEDLAAAGKKLYESTCIACHGTGAAGAPKFGDKDAWAPRIAEGMDAMMKIALNGKGAMPPRGGSSASDDELQAAVIYMADASGGHFAKDEKQGAQAAAAPAEKGETQSSEAKAGTAGSGVDVAAGKKLYESTCIACHGTGAAGAPKFGDKDAWAPRIKQGEDTLVKAAIAGIGAMPPRGGSNATDAEMRDAVVYMTDASGADFAKGGAKADSGESSDKAAGAAKSDDASKASDDKAETKDAKTSDGAKADAAGEPKVDLAAGKKLYESTCFACHGTGAAGAPKFGDKDAWAPRIKQGMDTLVKTAIAGIGAMPPRGGSNASDDEMRDAVTYMVDHSK